MINGIMYMVPIPTQKSFVLGLKEAGWDKTFLENDKCVKSTFSFSEAEVIYAVVYNLEAEESVNCYTTLHFYEIE